MPFCFLYLSYLKKNQAMNLYELKEKLILEAGVVNDSGTIRVITKEENTDDNEDCIWVADVLVFSRPKNKFLIRDLHKDDEKHHILTDYKGVIDYFKGWNNACDDFLSASGKKDDNSEIYINSYVETIKSLCDSEKDKLEKFEEVK